jgi:anti-sigma factor RsiW
VQAYFDAEVDALSAADIERHIERCAECRALLEDLEQVRGVLRQESDYVRTPPSLRAEIMRALDEESAAAASRAGGLGAGAERPDMSSSDLFRRPAHRTFNSRRLRPFWTGAVSGAFGATIAAGIAFFLLTPPLVNPLLDELVSAHVRSLMPDHLIDVVSTDKHTVKPWFAGHADVSPAVADFDSQGYRLVGGRADYFEHQRAAVVVFRHASHVINVFSWASSTDGLPKNTTRNGYHLAFWRTGNLDYCAVSDTGWDELMRLVQLLQDQNAHDNRGS